MCGLAGLLYGIDVGLIAAALVGFAVTALFGAAESVDVSIAAKNAA